MKMRISFQNSGGELDHKVATSEKEAATRAIEMIESAGELEPGDKIVVTEAE